MRAAVTASMADRTGRSLDEWATLVHDTSGVDPLDQNAVRRWLKDVHGVPQNTRWTIAFEVAERAGWERPDVDGYVAGPVHGPQGRAAADLRRARGARCSASATTCAGRAGRRTCRSSAPASSPRSPRRRPRASTSGCGSSTRRPTRALVPATAPGSATHKVGVTDGVPGRRPAARCCAPPTSRTAGRTGVHFPGVCSPTRRRPVSTICRDWWCWPALPRGSIRRLLPTVLPADALPDRATRPRRRPARTPMPPKIKTALFWIIAIFLVYAIVTSPDRAADLVQRPLGHHRQRVLQLRPVLRAT